MFLGLTWYSWMGIIGIPSFITIIGCLVKQGEKINILMRAIQSQMRTNLLADYRIYKEAGYISEEQMEDWENRYQSYHKLGQNGILDCRRDELLRLPCTPTN